MANVSKRRHNRRRLAALTFLSNISLDGTHRDTTLGILNLNVQGSKSERSRLVKDATDTSVRINRHLLNRRSTISECVDSRESEKSNRWSDTEEKHGSFYQYDYERHHSKNKDRVHKFVSDTKARLTNLSQKRKLIHQKSNLESHGLYSFTSTESLACTSRSRKASVSPSESSYSSVSEFRILKSVRDQHVYNGRVVLITSKKVPFVIFSTLPYLRRSTHGNVRSDVKPEGNRRRHTSSMRQLSIINDGPDPFELVALLGIEKPQEGQGISFSHLLAPTHLPRRCRSYAPELDHPPTVTHNLHPSGCMSFDQAIVVRTHCSFPSTALPNVPDKVSLERENPSVNCHHPCHASYPVYNPNLLDDPELIAGKHSTLLAFPSYITSVIDYVKPSDLKKDLNDKFRERFPHVHLTLSKLRSLKKEMVKITKHECSIDLLIVAQAYVYFEKLILKMLVNKQNRKLCAGACLLLSAKLNDVKGMDLRNLLEKIEAIFRVSRRDLVCLELGVLVALEFSLHLPTWEILPHYQRLIYES